MPPLPPGIMTTFPSSLNMSRTHCRPFGEVVASFFYRFSTAPLIAAAVFSAEIPYFSRSGPSGPGLAEHVLDPVHDHRGRRVDGQRFGDGPAEAADDRVLLAGHHQAGLLRCGDDGLDIERLDRRHVHQVHVDALEGQRLGSLEGTSRLRAGREHRDVGAFANDDGLAEYELVVVVEDDGRVGPIEPEVDRAVVLDDRLEGAAGLDLVDGGDHGHVGHGPHDRDVVEHQVGLAGHPGKQTGVATHHLHVRLRLGDENPDRVMGARYDEARERADDRDEAERRHAGGHAEHVLLGDAHLEEAVGVCGFEERRVCGASGVSVEHDEALSVSANSVIVSPNARRSAFPLASVVMPHLLRFHRVLPWRGRTPRRSAPCCATCSRLPCRRRPCP